MASLAAKLDQLRLSALEVQAQTTAEVVGQYLRNAYTNHADIVVLLGATLPSQTIEIIAKFSARLTIIGRFSGGFTVPPEHFQDRRSMHGVSECGFLMSPYANYLFDSMGLHSIRGLDPSLSREGVLPREQLTLEIDLDGTLSIPIGARSITIPLAAPTQQPQLSRYQIGPGQATEKTTTRVLYEALDAHADEMRSILANLAKLQDPREYLAEIEEVFEGVALTDREAELLSDILNDPWTNEGARGWDVLILPRAITTSEAVKYRALDSALPAIHETSSSAEAIGLHDLAAELEEVWILTSAELHGLMDVPAQSLRLEDRQPDGLPTMGEHLVFVGRLSHFSNDNLHKALERQARLLTIINRMTTLNVALQYRIRTVRTRAGHLAPAVDVVCTVTGCSRFEAAALRSSLGELVHAAFVGLYGLSFSFIRSESGMESRRYRARILPPTTDIADSLVSITSFPDWAYAIDYMCSLERPVELTLRVTAGGLVDRHPDLNESSSSGPSSQESHKLESMMSQVVTRLGAGRDYVNLWITLASDSPLPTPLLQMLCAEVGGESNWGYEEVEIDQIPPTRTLLSHALRIFHPPFGDVYGRSTAPAPLSLPVPVEDFPLGGLPLGIATTQHAKGNVEIQARLPEQDRLRHVYVIGKTGSGKTNLLRGLVSSEIGNPSTGLAVIDPHGDLAGHLLNLLPRSRFGDLQVVDLSDPELTPVMNPLLIEESSPLSRSRLSQGVLGLLKLRVFHEFSGPRFDEIARLLLDTLLDEGYPAVPSLVDASLLLTDKSIQSHVRSKLVDPELKARWAFHDNLKAGREYFDLLDWVISKFDDIAHDNTLRALLGGERNTVDIQRVVNANGVLAVSIPESVVGKDAAEFVGSLVLLQLKAALLRRKPDQSEPFYLYVDEFQKFAGIGFEEMLAEARKFGVGLVMAHQNMEQLRSFSQRTGQSTQALVNSILGNAGTMIVFPIGAQDAETLSRQIEIGVGDISRIARFEAIVKMTLEGHQLPAFTVRTSYAEPGLNPRNMDDMREYLANGGLMARRSAVTAEIESRRSALRQPPRAGGAGAAASPEAPTQRPDTTNFLDEWLRKRRDVEDAPKEPANTSDRLETPKRGRVGLALSAGSARVWGEVIGPVVRLDDVVKYLDRSKARLKADSERGRILILTTQQGTEVVPSSHFEDGKLLEGLSEVLRILDDAPYGAWTRAAWLATKNAALGDMSPLEYLRAGLDRSLLLVLATAYSEED